MYEGSYWDLMKQCEDMQEYLEPIAQVPPFLDEPVLNLPPKPDLPGWGSFKPEVILLPDPPKVCEGYEYT